MGYELRREICKAKMLRRQKAEKPVDYDAIWYARKEQHRLEAVANMENYMASDEWTMDCTPITNIK